MKGITVLLVSIVLAGCATVTHSIKVPINDSHDHFGNGEALQSLDEAKIAVLPFSSDETEMAWHYAEDFSLFLGKLGRFQMVKRLQVEKLFAEQDFDPKRIDDSTAVKIGRMLGAKGVVIGSSRDYIMNVRLVNTETGLQVWNARQTLNPDVKLTAAVRSEVAALLVSTLCKAALGIYVIDPNDLSERGRRLYGVSDISGAVVADIMPGSKAGPAGLKIGDVINAIDGRSILNSTDVFMSMFGRKPGEVMSVNVKRRGERLSLQIPLIPRKF
jgi:TolB-like protein